MLNFYSKYLFGVWQRLNGKHSILESTFLVQDSLLQIPQNDAVTEVAWFGKVLNYHNFYESKVQRALFCIIIRSDWVYLRHNTLTENYKNQNKPKTTKKEIWVYLNYKQFYKISMDFEWSKKRFCLSLFMRQQKFSLMNSVSGTASIAHYFNEKLVSKVTSLKHRFSVMKHYQ